MNVEDNKRSFMVGLITFHGSHNHGSMLQAYATQKSIESLGYDVEIINFRMPSQKEYYALYQTKYGKMRLFRGLLMLPIHNARKKREDKFEKFLKDRYKLSEEEYSSYDDLKHIAGKYDVCVSGSDQIWSNRIPELVGSDIDYTGVYFLDFADDKTKRISYASSIGEAGIDDLLTKKELLCKYTAISTRERKGAEVLQELTGYDVETVVDPTFLLNSSQWRQIEARGKIVPGKYIFLYTLRGIRPGMKWARELTSFAKKAGLKVVCVSPFFPIVYPGMKCLVNIGPEDFINLIDHAELVFTDSFHGTAFSINLQKPFYSLTLASSNDNRKVGFIKELGLEKRILRSYGEIGKIKDYSLDYSKAAKILNQKREESMKWLAEALQKASKEALES